MRVFDYSFLKDELIKPELVNLTSTICIMRERAELRKKEYKKIYTELEKKAKIESVKTSNAIEGIVTSDERILSIVNETSKPQSHTEEEIAGYKDCLKLIHENYSNIDISEETILRLHEILFSYNLVNNEKGVYKNTNNLIIEINEYGERRVRFKPISAKETKKAMEQFILAYQDANTDSRINTLLLIPCFILDFLCIHPFKDGNGRISRLLSLLLLYKAGFDVGKYESFEAQINNSKETYYNSLEESSQNWESNDNEYMLFINYFLSTLYYCYKELDKQFVTINNKKVNKKNRIEAMVLNSIVPVSKSDICNFLPDVSVTTVEAVLGKMVKEGIINKIGNSRNTKYYRKL